MDRKQRSEMLKGREVRLSSTLLECRDADGGLAIRGYASVTETPYDMSFYSERISRGAFAKTLSENPDVQLLVNHEGLPLARSTNGSLRLMEDDKGLFFDADLDAGDPAARQLARKIASGLMDQCSFAFRVTRQTWDTDYENRIIQEVSLDRGDVSVCNYGASPTTSVSMRNLAEGLRKLAAGEPLPGEEWRKMADEFGLPLDAIEKIEARMRAEVEPVAAEEEPPITPAPPTTYIARAQALRLRGDAGM